MGLFNLKKSKSDSDDDFVASDEWLMGLAEDDPRAFSAGPNASIPTGLVDLDPLMSFEPAPHTEGSGSDDSMAPSWHLPDLDSGDAIARDTSPPPPPPPPPAILFDGSHLGTSQADPFPYDALVVEPTHDDATDSPGLGLPYLGDDPVDSAMIEHDAFAHPLDNLAPRVGTNRDAWFQDQSSDDAWIEGADLSLLDHGGTDHIGTDHGELRTGSPDAPASAQATSGGSPRPPRGPEPDMLCEILGVEPGADWPDLRAAHAQAMAEYDPDLESDEDRAALARAIRREINSSYAALRLLASD